MYVVLCLIVFGCQYRCNWLPRKTRLWMTYYVSSGTLNPTHSLTHLVYGSCWSVRCILSTAVCRHDQVRGQDIICRDSFALCLLYIVCTLCFKKRTPKTGWYNFIKIGPLGIISFQRMHRHLIANWLRLKSLIWVECQLCGFHGNNSTMQEHVYKKPIRNLNWSR